MLRFRITNDYRSDSVHSTPVELLWCSVCKVMLQEGVCTLWFILPRHTDAVLTSMVPGGDLNPSHMVISHIIAHALIVVPSMKTNRDLKGCRCSSSVFTLILSSLYHILPGFSLGAKNVRLVGNQPRLGHRYTFNKCVFIMYHSEPDEHVPSSQ